MGVEENDTNTRKNGTIVSNGNIDSNVNSVGKGNDIINGNSVCSGNSANKANGNINDNADEGLAALRRQPSIRDRKKVISQSYL